MGGTVAALQGCLLAAVLCDAEGWTVRSAADGWAVATLCSDAEGCALITSDGEVVGSGEATRFEVPAGPLQHRRTEASKAN